LIFQVDPNAPKAVYQQLVEQVRYAVAAGRLREGDRLPPIRDVAVQVRVNRNTVARAYMELERQGVLRTRPGQGSFITNGAPEVGKAKARQMLAEAIDEVLAHTRQLRLSEEEFLSVVKERLEKVDLDRE